MPSLTDFTTRLELQKAGGVNLAKIFRNLIFSKAKVVSLKECDYSVTVYNQYFPKFNWSCCSMGISPGFPPFRPALL